MLRDSIQLAPPSLYVEWQHPIGSTITLCWETASDRLYCHFTLRDIWLALMSLYVGRRQLMLYRHFKLTDSIRLTLLSLYIERQHLIGSTATLHWGTASNWLSCHFHIAKWNLLSCTATFKPTDRNGMLHCRFHSNMYQQICTKTTCKWRIPNFGTAHLLILS